MGSDGIEPSSAPYHHLPLIRRRLSPLSYEPNYQVRPEGFEPPPCRLKACCAAVTPRTLAQPTANFFVVRKFQKESILVTPVKTNQQCWAIWRICLNRCRNIFVLLTVKVCERLANFRKNISLVTAIRMNQPCWVPFEVLRMRIELPSAD